MMTASKLVLALSLLLGLSGCGGGGGGGGLPVDGGGGGGGGGTGGGGTGGDGLDPTLPDPLTSEFLVTPAFGTPADGRAEVGIRFRLASHLGRPLAGVVIQLDASGYANGLDPLPPTGPDGRTETRLRSRAAEAKLIRARAVHDGRLIDLGTRQVVFLEIPPEARFVRAGGSDGNSGRSPVEAWRTLDHALTQVEAGATLFVGAGHYPGPLLIERDFGAGRPLTLRGDRSGRMTGDPGAVVIEAGGSPHALALRRARGVVLRDLDFVGAGAGLHIEDSSDVLVLGCRATENEFGLVIEGAEGLTVSDCRVSGNLRDGMLVGQSQRARLENNLLYANGGSGIALLSPATGVEIRHNTLYRNQAGNLIEEALGGSGSIEENVLSEGGTEDLGLLFDTNYSSGRNLVSQTPLGGRQDPEDGLVVGDPLFVDPFGADGILGGAGEADDDFRVLPESLALDAGMASARARVLPSNEALALRTTRSDGLREAQGLDGDRTNLGFHYPVADEPFVSLAPGEGHVVHALPGQVVPRLRRWDRAAPGQLGAGAGPALGAETAWIEARTTPLDGPEEVLAALVDTGSSVQLVVRRWNGRFWDDPLDSPFRDGLPRSVLADRAFDLEYEAQRGRAFLVTALDSESPSFRVFENGRWSAETPVHAAPVPGVAGKIRWVELVPYRDGNDLALLTLTEQRQLVVTLWDGTRWGTPRRLETTVFFQSGWRPFDAAWENASGDLLVAWSFNVFAEETRWASLHRDSGTWTFGQHPATDAVGAHVALASDPVSDKIAAVLSEGGLDGDVSVSVWDGEQWTDTAELTLLGPVRSQLPAVTWIGNTGIAAVFFRRLGTSGSFDWALYLPNGWRIQPAVVLQGVGRAVRVHLRSLVDRGRLVGTLLDENGKLFGLGYDGTRFALLDGGRPLAEGLDPGAPGRPFDVVLRRP